MITLVLEGGRRVPITHPVITNRPFKGDRLVKVRLYGALAKAAGRKVFELAISSVREAITALHYLTDSRTTMYIDRTNDRVRWRVLVNNEQIDGDQPSVADELMIERAMETIDIYPVMEGAGNFLGLILGVLMLIVGIVLAFTGVGLMAFELIVAGVAGILGGLMSLFTKPSSTPKQKASKGNPSYLFSGTVNTQDQGGPVPVCYGNAIIGSQTISAFVVSSDLYMTGMVTVSGIGPQTGTKLPSPFILKRNARKEEIAAAAETALTQSWQELGPAGFWGYCNGVTIIPNAYNLAVQQQPVGQYPSGPCWLIRFDGGGLGANYDPGGNNGPWDSLNTAPQEIDAITLTQNTAMYANFAATPNIP